MKVNISASFYAIKNEIAFMTEINPFSGNWFSFRSDKYFDKN